MAHTIKLEADICIAGGGMAGVCAAIAAARSGATVVLLQDRSVLGGNASSEIRMHIAGASCSGRRPGARESGLIDEIRVEDAVRNPHRSPHLFDLLLYDMVRREPSITLLLDTDCVGCDTEAASHAPGQRLIRRVHAVRTLTEDRFVIEAAFFADCTGDSRLGIEAGAAMHMGREARHEFDEPDAPLEADSAVLGSTILFTAHEMDHAVPFTAPPWARRFSEEDLRLRSHREFEYGYWWVEWGGHLDTVRDNDRIRHELLAIAMGVWDHVKNHCTQPPDPSAAYEKWMAGQAPPAASAANWALDWVGMLPGKRESRRLLGPHVLTQDDVTSGRLFHDTVAYGGWWIDLHPPTGVDAVNEYPCRQIEVPYLYGIPLRSLYSRNVANLWMAGRNISATHLAFASTRVMATCAVMGQAVGTAMAMAARRRLAAASELLEPSLLDTLQQTLLADDCFLPGIAERMPHARYHASSEVAGHEAPLAGNGITRALDPRLHPAFAACSNQWVSAELPAWLDLEWEEERAIHGVELIFDTGFARELTLSMSDAFTRKMIRGPQPETVSDYALSAGERQLRFTGNHQRRCVHRFEEPWVTRRLRLTVERTHGATQARVFAIRVRTSKEAFEA
ncbi:MAG: FAD-dependent oxidoreductase [Bryobacterales bacterium]|nr:FAD-dependent oxidoreductase [Bryobacterales bacterium]